MAFSLTELLVVIAIVAILAALVLTSILPAKQKVRQAQCAHNESQIAMGVQVFITDNRCYPLYFNSKFRAGGYAEHQTTWQTAIEGILTHGDPVNTHISAIVSGASIWQCPAAPRPPSFPSDVGYNSYGYNGFGLGAGTNASGKNLGLGGHYGWKGSPDKSMAPPVRDSEVANPSQLMLLGDGFKGGKGIIVDGLLVIGRNNGLEDYFGSTARAVNRHRKNANIAFCDGHVEALKLTYLFEDNSDAALSRWNRDNLPHRELLDASE